MQVIKMMNKGAKNDSGFYQYRNALKTYFNRDNVSITQVQADNACERMLEYYNSYDPTDPQKEKKFFEAFLYVLMYVGVRAVYDRANSTADLIGTDGSIVMSKLQLKNTEGGRTVLLNPVKNTGVSYLPLIITAGVGAPVLVLGAVLVLRRKGRESIHGD